MLSDRLERIVGDWVSASGLAAWRFGMSVREYREIEAGDREPTLGTYQRIYELYGWPQTFVAVM